MNFVKKNIEEQWFIQQNMLDDQGIQEQGWESLFALCNGYIGIRGSVEFGSANRNPHTYFAGFFDKPDISESSGTYGLNIKNKAQTPCYAITPVFDDIEIEIENSRVDFLNCSVKKFNRHLDFKRGLLFSEYKLQNSKGHIISIEAIRMVSRHDAHISTLMLRVVPINFSLPIAVKFVHSLKTDPEFIPRIKDYISSTELAYNESKNEVVTLCGKVSQTHQFVSVSSKIFSKHIPTFEKRKNGIVVLYNIQGYCGQGVEFTKANIFYTSLDAKNCMKRSFERALKLKEKDITKVFNSHVAELKKLWDIADIKIESDSQSQIAVRWSIFQLIMLANPWSNDVSISATGLHGTGYFGHIFWDTEIWIIPYYIATNPDVASNLLLYRYNRLDSARKNAKQEGFDGAKFPWTSAASGMDVTPPDWRSISGKEIHINGAILYAFDLYLKWTGDLNFFLNYGVEIFVETAKFWLSRSELGSDNKYHINNVVGPDEYNIYADDNYYTNYCAYWNVLKALEWMELIRNDHPRIYEKVVSQTGWNNNLKKKFSAFKKQIYFPKTRQGVCEQYRGFFDLPDIKPMTRGAYGKPVPSEACSYDGSNQMSKQADAVMMHYLFGDDFPLNIQKSTYAYYHERCNQGSSLSPSIFCIMGQRLELYEHTFDYFQLSSLMDIKNLHLDNTLHEGIHTACCAGTWKSVIFGFGGLKIKDNTISISPALPSQWKSVEFSLYFLQRRIQFKLSSDKFIVKIHGPDLSIYIYDKKHILKENSELYIEAEAFVKL